MNLPFLEFPSITVGVFSIPIIILSTGFYKISRIGVESNVHPLNTAESPLWASYPNPLPNRAEKSLEGRENSKRRSRGNRLVTMTHSCPVGSPGVT